MDGQTLATVRRRVIEIAWQVHRWFYQRTGGRLGGRLLGMPVLLLTTVGRRTGKPRTTALTYFSDGHSFAVIASNGGAPRHPDWFLNLRAAPRAAVQVGSRQVRVLVRVAEGQERDRLWARVIGNQPIYAGYQARTSRLIPIVVLDPVF